MVKVLVIDDDPMVRAVLADILTSEGLEPALASDGPTAIDTVKRMRPPVAPLDLSMPGMSGMEVLGERRKIDPLLSGIILTASTDVSTAVQDGQARHRGGGAARDPASARDERREQGGSGADAPDGRQDALPEADAVRNFAPRVRGLATRV